MSLFSLDKIDCHSRCYICDTSFNNCECTMYNGLLFHMTQPTSRSKGAARGGAEGAQAPPLAIRILMFIS